MVTTGRPAPLRPDARPAAGLPPHDVSAEEAVIAALLLDEDAFPRVLPILQPVDFFREQHGWCYEACLALSDRGEAVYASASWLARMPRMWSKSSLEN